MGRGYPGTPVPVHLSNIQKVEHIEKAIKTDVCERVSDLRPDVRLIPYLSLHEYDALLFSDPRAFAEAVKQSQLAGLARKSYRHFKNASAMRAPPPLGGAARESARSLNRRSRLFAAEHQSYVCDIGAGWAGFYEIVQGFEEVV